MPISVGAHTHRVNSQLIDIKEAFSTNRVPEACSFGATKGQLKEASLLVSVGMALLGIQITYPTLLKIYSLARRVGKVEYVLESM